MSNLINAKELVPILLQYKKDYPDKKVAFCFSGGGARGAYFGGVIEAIQQEINRLQDTILPENRWIPDIVCGTSAGAISGFSYWMECLLPGSPFPFACRQSKIWYDISNGNKGAEKLFDNHYIIEYLSKSSVTLDAFLDALDRFDTDIQPVIQNLDRQWTDIKLIISNVGSFDVARLQGNIQNRVNQLKGDLDAASDPPGRGSNLGDWKNYANDIFDLIKDMHTIIPYMFQDLSNMQLDQARNLLQNIKDLKSDIEDGHRNDIGKIFRELRELIYKLQSLYTELKIVFFFTKFYIKECSSLMNTNGLQNFLENFIFNSFPQNTFNIENGQVEAKKLDEAIINLVKERILNTQKVPDIFMTGTNINAKRGVAFSLAPYNIYNKVANRNLWVIKLDDESTEFSTHRMIGNDFIFGGKQFGEDHSHNADLDLEEIIKEQAKQAEIEAAIRMHDGRGEGDNDVKPGEGRGEVNINVKAGEGRGEANINVKPGEGKDNNMSPEEIKKLSERAEEGRDDGNNVLSDEVRQSAEADHQGRGGNNDSMSSQDNNVFHNQIIGKVFQRHEIRSNISFSHLNRVSTILTSPVGVASNVLTHIKTDPTKGKSLFVGAVLTSATIPIAFPPRQWTFFSQAGVKFKHWMVDGGIVDNRPIDAAVKAGAEFIISFELTPLLSATTELKKEFKEYPKFMEVISKSMTDSTLNAGFYRYFEDLVTENNDFLNLNGNQKYIIYRMAPMMYNSPEDVEYINGVNLDDNTIGTYDFNGKYDKDRNLRMGIFDWFMKGYIDTLGIENVDMNDLIYSTYMNLSEEFGAKKNAIEGRRSGFYDASLQAHPV